MFLSPIQKKELNSSLTIFMEETIKFGILLMKEEYPVNLTMIWS